jgi:type VI secretion system secreted protein VgrG
MTLQTVDAIERRRRNIRIILFIIILATLPFYCAGFLLWGTAPRQNARNLPTATFTPIGREVTATSTRRPTSTPPFVTRTSISPLGPTPFQFIPPTRIPPTATIFLPPTSTLAPTLTPYPTDTPLPTNTQPPPPTSTPLPLPTDTPIPTDTPVPTNTEAPPPTEPPTPEPLPTDAPVIPATETPAV